MTGRRTIVAGVGAGVAGGLAILLIVWFAVGGGGSDRSEADTAPRSEGPLPPLATAGDPVRDEDLRPVALFFPGGDEFLLRPESREIFWTALLTDRARQVVAELLRGSELPGRRPLLPPGLTLREVFVLPGGNTWVDLSGANGRPAMGSLEERAAIEGLALSLTGNFAEIERVGLLIDGEQVESLAGHMDLTRTYTGTDWLPAGIRLDDLLPQDVLDAREAAAASAAVASAGQATAQ